MQIKRCFDCDQPFCICTHSVDEMLTTRSIGGDPDNRWGGAAWEGHKFDETGKSVDPITHEKKHYQKSLLSGYEYVDKGIEKEVEDSTGIDLEQSELEEEGWKKKKKSGIDWKNDPSGQYKKLLKKLKKASDQVAKKIDQ